MKIISPKTSEFLCEIKESGNGAYSSISSLVTAKTDQGFTLWKTSPLSGADDSAMIDTASIPLMNDTTYAGFMLSSEGGIAIRNGKGSEVTNASVRSGAFRFKNLETNVTTDYARFYTMFDWREIHNNFDLVFHGKSTGSNPDYRIYDCKYYTKSGGFAITGYYAQYSNPIANKYDFWYEFDGTDIFLWIFNSNQALDFNVGAFYENNTNDGYTSAQGKVYNLAPNTSLYLNITTSDIPTFKVKPKSSVSPQSSLKSKVQIRHKLSSAIGLTSNLKYSISYIGWGKPQYLFDESEGIKEISVTFDQLGRPLVLYRINDDDIYLYWFNFNTGQAERKFLTKGVNPIAGFDLVHDTSDPKSDALLFYRRGNRVYMRIQRDKFDIEYDTRAHDYLPTGAKWDLDDVRLADCGLRVDWRFQVRYLYPVSGPTPPPDPPKPNPVGIYDYRGKRSSVVLTDKYTAIESYSFGFTVAGTYEKVWPWATPMFGWLQTIASDSRVNCVMGWQVIQLPNGQWILNSPVNPVYGYSQYGFVSATTVPLSWLLENNVVGSEFVIKATVHRDLIFSDKLYWKYEVFKDGVLQIPIFTPYQVASDTQIEGLTPPHTFVRPVGALTLKANSNIVVGGFVALLDKTQVDQPPVPVNYESYGCPWLIQGLWYKLGANAIKTPKYDLMYTDQQPDGFIFDHRLDLWKRELKPDEVVIK